MFELHKVSPFQVYELIKNLSTSKASGLDNIPVRLLKLIHFSAIVSLTHIINSVVCKGIVPPDWKYARQSISNL